MQHAFLHGGSFQRPSSIFYSKVCDRDGDGGDVIKIRNKEGETNDSGGCPPRDGESLLPGTGERMKSGNCKT